MWVSLREQVSVVLPLVCSERPYQVLGRGLLYVRAVVRLRWLRFAADALGRARNTRAADGRGCAMLVLIRM